MTLKQLYLLDLCDVPLKRIIYYVCTRHDTHVEVRGHCCGTSPLSTLTCVLGIKLRSSKRLGSGPQAVSFFICDNGHHQHHQNFIHFTIFSKNWILVVFFSHPLFHVSSCVHQLDLLLLMMYVSIHASSMFVCEGQRFGTGILPQTLLTSKLQILLSPPPQCPEHMCALQCLAFLGFGRLNSGPLVCSASVSPSEPSSQPRYFSASSFQIYILFVGLCAFMI